MRRFVLLLQVTALVSCGSGDNATGVPGGIGGATHGGAEGGAVSAGEDSGTLPGQGNVDDAGGEDGAVWEGAAEDGATAVPPDGAPGGLGPYASDGPYAVTTVAFPVTSPNATYTTTAYIPSATGPDPVVILSSGFYQDGDAYGPYASRLASWGILTFVRDDPNLGESTPDVVSDVSYEVDTWLATTNADSTSAVHGKVDLTRVGLAGHSRGGQIALLAGEGLVGKIKGVFGIDPVDTSSTGDPGARTTLATIGVPLAFIGETTDSAASSCAPAADNFMVLYGTASSPAVAITAIGADHTMFELPADCSFCTLCTAGTASQPTVLATAVRYLTAFFARQLLGDASVGAAFAGAGINQDVPAGIVSVVSK